MAVFMKRSTNMAPVALSTSYFTGSLWDGISMMTLMSLGTSLPEVTRSRFITVLVLKYGRFWHKAGLNTPRRWDKMGKSTSQAAQGSMIKHIMVRARGAGLLEFGAPVRLW